MQLVLQLRPLQGACSSSPRQCARERVSWILRRRASAEESVVLKHLFLGQLKAARFLVLVGACGCKAYVSNVLTKMSWGHFGSSETGVCWEQIGRKSPESPSDFLS